MIGRMNSGQPLRDFRNDELLFFKRSQTFLGFRPGRKVSKLKIIGIMLG
jgi:hypothetical protein